MFKIKGHRIQKSRYLKLLTNPVIKYQRNDDLLQSEETRDDPVGLIESEIDNEIENETDPSKFPPNLATKIKNWYVPNAGKVQNTVVKELLNVLNSEPSIAVSISVASPCKIVHKRKDLKTMISKIGNPGMFAYLGLKKNLQSCMPTEILLKFSQI